MIYLLDTNICIYIIKKKPPEVLQMFNKYSVAEIGISSISVAELEYGVQKSKYPDRNREALEQFLLPLVVVDFDYNAAIVYGKIRSELESLGKPIGSLDNLIAAQALSLGLTVVTNNTKEFS
ncbi:MAG: type II toxin-antitoxin system VapC family toxin [Candidatus Aminicenantes bacterium]|nr:type II toxin-antitoxin system VapC family toxin [Candidatus Aminicenantes bacterium]